MQSLSTPRLRVVLEPSLEPGFDRRFEVLQSLLAGGHSVTCPTKSGSVAPHDESELLVLSDTPGVGEVESDTEPDTSGGPKLRVKEIAGLAPEEVVDAVRSVQRETESYAPGEWQPWFPVIDYDRCTHCMQCLSFCLFDVYGVDDEKKIEVRNNDKCKTNCPACSRVCPEVAILFPKYGSGPINGDEVNDQDVDREKMKTDISALLGGDIYTMLRERHANAASRFSKERDEARALKERMKCLKKLGAQLDIPEEVMMALPSLDEIMAKAAAAYDAVDEGKDNQGS